MLNFRSVFLESLPSLKRTAILAPFTGPGPKKEMSCFHGGAVRFGKVTMKWYISTKE